LIAGSHKLGPLESRGASNTLEVPHVDWGQGMMVAGRNPFYWERHPRFEVKPA